jgi:ketosteroid isomerase-like protein
VSSANVRHSLAEHVAIGHLLNQYTNSLNTADWETLGGLFAEDATWRVIADGDVKYQHDGARAIAAGLRDAVTAGAAVMHQMNHAPVIHVDGDRATASSTIEELYWGTNGTRVHLYAIYSDELVCEEDGEWRFRRREFRPRGKLTFDDQGPGLSGPAASTGP